MQEYLCKVLGKRYRITESRIWSLLEVTYKTVLSRVIPFQACCLQGTWKSVTLLRITPLMVYTDGLFICFQLCDSRSFEEADLIEGIK